MGLRPSNRASVFHALFPIAGGRKVNCTNRTRNTMDLNAELFVCLS